MARVLSRGLGFVAASVAVHVALGVALASRPAQAPRPRRVSEAWFVVPEPAPEPAVPEAVVEPEPEVMPPPAPERPAPRARPRPRQAAAAPAPAEPAPSAPVPAREAAPEPADFSGLTLTNAGSTGWASALGSGAPLQGPVGPAGSRGAGQGAGRAATGSNTGAASGGPTLVSVGDLSRAPRPPDLDGSLRRLYPESARRQGLEGDVRMSVTVLPTGQLGRLRVLAATDERFAQACTRLLRGSHWSPPLDQTGEPVATVVAYRCQFLLE